MNWYFLFLLSEFLKEKLLSGMMCTSVFVRPPKQVVAICTLSIISEKVGFDCMGENVKAIGSPKYK